MITLDADADGRSVEVPVGETVELMLDEPGGGGYVWSWNLSDGLVQLSEERRPPGWGAAPGAVTHRSVRFRIEQAGRHRVQAQLGRPWERHPDRSLVVELIGLASG
jgi:predicted secreted protein